MEKCPICVEEITDTARLDCQHSYCYDCIWNWCRFNNVCPLCKAPVKVIHSSMGLCIVCVPEVAYGERINDYIVRRDYVVAPGGSPNDATLEDFVVSDSKADESSYDEDDGYINVKLSPNDYQPVSSRTRSRKSTR